MSEEVELTNEQLDELYVKEVRSVASIVAKLPNNTKIANTVKRWLNIFESASADEKFARNWMLLQMHNQLNDQNTLGYPFTDARSSEHDLATLHKLSLMQLQQELPPMASNEDDISVHSDLMEVTEDNVSLSLEAVNQLLIEKNEALVMELRELQAKKERLLEQRQNILNNNSDKNSSSDDKSIYDEDMKYMKELLAYNIMTTLKLFDQYTQPNYFVSLFAFFCEDQQDEMQFRELDTQLGGLLRNYIKHHKRLVLLNQSEAAYDEMRRKIRAQHKKWMRMRASEEMAELSEACTRCFTVLRKLFRDSYKGDKQLQRKVLQFFDNARKELDGSNFDL